MTLPEYLSDVAREMRAKSAGIRRDFASHHPSAGENREHLVADFLDSHLPKKFGVSSGLIISHEGLFSNQADLVIVDQINNAPLYGTTRNKLWPIEAVYALVEVKTSLTPSNISDAVEKGRRFKTLPRRFCQSGQVQLTTDSLFVIWAFDAPSPEKTKDNLTESFTKLHRAEQPDLIVVPDSLVAQAGNYLELVRLGMPGSQYRQELEVKNGKNLKALLPEVVEVSNCGENALLAWYIWFDSWLRHAGVRLTDPLAYLPPSAEFGHKV
jgi:hypothetical protein